MPIHEFECECGVQFERFYKTVSKVAASEPCPDCGNTAHRLVSGANHTFAHTPTGPVPQNTGVSSIDHSYDRVIGRDAAAKWRTIEDRKSYKDGIVRDERKAGKGVENQHLVRTRDGAGDYRVVKEPERQEINARRQVINAISKKAAE